MNVMIISSAKNAVGARLLQRGFEDAGHVCRVLSPRKVLHDAFIPDVVIPRFSPRSVNETVALLKQIKNLYPKAILIVDDEAINLSFNKLSTYKCFVSHDVPTPHTWHKSIKDSTPIILSVVAKPVIGNRGEGIFLVQEPTALAETVARGDYLVQEYIQNPVTQDVRAFVIGGRVVAAMKRTAPEGDFITNLAAGGSAVATHLDDATQAVAIRACKSLHLAIGGVDLMASGNGYVVLEVNPSPGFKVGEVCGIDIPKLIVKYAERLTHGGKHD